MPTITGLYRYPIKGLSAQPLTFCQLEAGRPLGNDRVFALVRPGAPIDPVAPTWGKKGLFAMLMLDAQLASVRTFLDTRTLRLSATRDDLVMAEGNLADADDREALERFFWTLLPDFPAPPRLVRSKAGHFMDKPDSVISLINLATIRDLENRWDIAIDPMRFRANIYVDGVEPWAEFDWIGHAIRVGDTALRVDRRNGRCGATNVDPLSGQRNRDIPGRLRATFGHKDLGVYLVVERGGTVAMGQAFEAPTVDRTIATVTDGVHARTSTRRQFICNGCYHIYDEELGLPDKGIRPGTPFEDIDKDWPCPDCGTGKGTYAPVRKSQIESGSKDRQAPPVRSREVGRWTDFVAFVTHDIVVESDEITSFILKPDDGRILPAFLPGQHVQVRVVPQDGRADITRTYSLSGSARLMERDHYRISVRRLTASLPDGTLRHGLMSNFLARELAIGDTVWLKPPAGRFVLPSHSEQPIVLVAAGAGITPFMSYLEAAPEAPSIVLLYGNRNGRLHAFRQQLRGLQRQLPALHVVDYYSQPLAEDRPTADYDHVGRIDAAAVMSAIRSADMETPTRRPLVYMCGPNALMEAVARGLIDAGIDPLDIHRETFTAPATTQAGGDGVFTVTFARSAVTSRWTSDKGVLASLADSSGVFVPSGCRVGECGSCAARIISGCVAYVSDPDPGVCDPEACLTCQAFPASDLVIDL